MKKILAASCLLVVMYALPTIVFAQDTPEPEVLVVKFHADWCSSCKTIGPAFSDLSEKLDDQSILFIELDFTDNSTRHQANLLSSALGIDRIVAENNATGFLLVIDAETKEVKKKLTKVQSVEEMTNAIASYL